MSEVANPLSAKPTPIPADPVAKKADTSSFYWDEAPTSASQHKGVSLKQWMKEVEQAGLRLGQVGGVGGPAMQKPIKKPTGAMRPVGELPEQFPHRHGRGEPTLKRISSYAKRESASEVTLKLLPALLKKLSANASRRGSGSDRDLPNEVVRICREVQLPLDDHELLHGVKQCRPDADGLVSVSQFVSAMRATHERIVQREMLANDPVAGGDFAVPEARFAAALPVPKHAYSAADIPKLVTDDRGKTTMQNVAGDPFGREQNYFELLPADVDCQPHRSAERQRRLLAMNGRSAEDTLVALRTTLAMQDRTRSGSLPQSTVTQYLKLHGLWPSRSDEEWSSLYAKHASEDLTRRIDYKALLAAIAGK